MGSKMDETKHPCEVSSLGAVTSPLGNPTPAVPGSADAGSTHSAAEIQESPEQPEPSGHTIPKETKSVGCRVSKAPHSGGASLTKLSKAPRPGLSKLIMQAVASSQTRAGLSLQALKKAIAGSGYDLARKKTHFKRVLLNLVTKGLLQKLKGTGASGSFGLGKERAKKQGPGPRRKKVPKKRGRHLKVGIAATSLAERGQLLTLGLLRRPGQQPAILGKSQPAPEG
ncbi:histone H1.01-like [Carettochelys insculpta]|uniref:histone H1.01-like n=1 Tax=Carettochelys insculpta TaxID=44489 RepID=UPI003EBD614E